MMLLPRLGDITAHDPQVVGHKAANLSRFSTVAHVPEGFCVPHHTGADELRDAVAAAYSCLCIGASLPVAVRSSALDEDGAGASFAGLYETLLNVRDAAAVVDAVLRCRGSGRSDAVTHYRRIRGLSPHSGPIPVLVQHLIPAEVSAVAFSADPVTGATDRIVVNANWGLGDSIVAGRVTPDCFHVCKHSGDLLHSNVTIKTMMTVAAPEGVTDVAVPGARQSRPSLENSQLAELARLARDLEHIVGSPVDVECAFSAGMLWLLQCRPITTIRGGQP